MSVDSSMMIENLFSRQIDDNDSTSSQAIPSCITYDDLVFFTLIFWAILLSGNIFLISPLKWSAWRNGILCSAINPDIRTSAFTVISSVSGSVRLLKNALICNFVVFCYQGIKVLFRGFMFIKPDLLASFNLLSHTLQMTIDLFSGSRDPSF